jgi:hypothetical protein
VAWVFVRAIAQHTKDGFTFSHTHTQKKQKEQLKFKTQKNSIEKPKRREKRKFARKIRDK